MGLTRRKNEGNCQKCVGKMAWVVTKERNMWSEKGATYAAGC